MNGYRYKKNPFANRRRGFIMRRQGCALFLKEKADTVQRNYSFSVGQSRHPENQRTLPRGNPRRSRRREGRKIHRREGRRTLLRGDRRRIPRLGDDWRIRRPVVRFPLWGRRSR